MFYHRNIYLCAKYFCYPKHKIFMQKPFILFLFLLVATTAFAQKNVVQHAAYTGFSYRSLPLSYDARFRNFEAKKPDFAIGASVLIGSYFGFRPHASALFGKGNSVLEIGLNANFQYSPYYPYATQERGLNFIGTTVNPYFGYRYQPKNGRFFLQILYSPFMFYNLREYKDNFTNYIAF